VFIPRESNSRGVKILIMKSSQHNKWMAESYKEALKANSIGEVPVGCVIVKNGQAIGRGHNCTITRNDPVGHAEIVAIRRAAHRIGNWRLTGATAYVTVKPCRMCQAAFAWARVSTIYYGSRPNKPEPPNKISVRYVRHNDSGVLMQRFFSKRR